MNTQTELAFLRLLHRCFTPYAFAVIFLGTIFAPLPKPTLHIALILLGVSLGLNVATAWIVSEYPDKARSFGYFHVTANLIVNVLLVHLLLPHWEPIWLLLPITLAGMAAYGAGGRCQFNNLMDSRSAISRPLITDLETA